MRGSDVVAQGSKLSSAMGSGVRASGVSLEP